MTNKRFIYYILIAYIAGNFLLLFLQFNSGKNINALITGNEKTLDELKTGNELRELERDIYSIESKVRGTVAARDTSPIEGFELQIAAVESALRKLQRIDDIDSSVQLIDQLGHLVQQKLMFSNKILDTLYGSGKPAAEKLMATHRGRELTDSIKIITRKIDSSRQFLLSRLTASIDESGRKAKTWGNILIVIVLISSAGLFWYIVDRMKQQQQLILQLNATEKKVRDTAQVKENFMANMSHEIRTPLNAILGFTNILQKKELDNESKEYVGIVKKSGENLLAIINDILDISKIEAGMIRIESSPFSIRSVITDIENMFREKINSKHIAFNIVTDPRIPVIVEGDAVRLTQILVNLVGNAIKFTDTGSITLEVKNITGNAKDISQISFIVSDTGIGIQKEKLPYIFERFEQAEDATTRKYGGTGLGLSIVKDLVVLQNGEINAESEPGEGSTFRFSIPYKTAGKNAAILQPDENRQNTPAIVTDTRILVAEDNIINQSLIRHLLSSWQLQFDIVQNGREVIEKLKENSYGLILMDIQMPELDGYTTTEQIREALKLDTPVIAMTAHAWAGEKEKCMSYGMNDYISKPIEEKKLYELLTDFLLLSGSRYSKNKNEHTVSAGGYSYINLAYMKEVSAGDIEYERLVTAQFIEIIPEDLLTLENACNNNDIAVLKQTVHNMKTTISVMGLNKILQPHLDLLESGSDIGHCRKSIASIKIICAGALKEAHDFYARSSGIDLHIKS